MVYPFVAAILKVELEYRLYWGLSASKNLPGHARYRHANEGCISEYG